MCNGNPEYNSIVVMNFETLYIVNLFWMRGAGGRRYVGTKTMIYISINGSIPMDYVNYRELIKMIR